MSDECFVAIGFDLCKTIVNVSFIKAWAALALAQM